VSDIYCFFFACFVVNRGCWGQLAEALLALAGLTADEGAREALYARAQVEGGDVTMQKLSPRLTRSRTLTMVVRMDES